ncbi:DUF3105 domain-containing protein [Nocardioides sp. KIGAM211]|uniref:DUF3105 domain-containing protein n=1 Tax=Nocardioides luti TaxID=2761101 RepID=A0A7X0RDA2_9ACTN|nr:DUF3105 domain-containing protein [Nocardioides luti]MBB6626193.1 DUF3105 domain-containing protein [Nocardioides luti]
MSELFPPRPETDAESDAQSDSAPGPVYGPEREPAPEPRRSRWPIVLAMGSAVLVIALAVLVPVAVQQVRADQDAQDATVAAANLDDVQVFVDERTDHVSGDVDYDAVPPAGGPHDPEWLDCGAYDAPVRDENAVHDLEHGGVWITYDPDLDAADVATLEAALPEDGIMSPYDGLPAPVVVTVWERQLRLTGADDPRLALFVAAFGDGHTAPEPFASCAGGLTDGSGGDSTTV